MTKMITSDAETSKGRTITRFAKSDEYRAEVHDLIAGGAHTYSKGDDQFAALSPAAIVSGRGGRVTDVDGNEFVDCALALGAVSLGHVYRPVVDAVHAQVERGANFQRPASIELDLARELVAAIPGAERVKFAKNGSTVTSAAVKLARAFTRRDLVAFPGNHAFYSYDDWFIGRTRCASGIPDAYTNLSVTYDSTKPETLETLFKQYPGRIAAVITEPEEVIPASVDALLEVVSIVRRHGALFIADEMVTGYRAGWPGACARIGIEPDMATWGKAMGNGFSFCALTGRADVMELGGIRQKEAPRVFLISTTHGGEAHGIAAARAVLHAYQTNDVLGRQRDVVSEVVRRMRRSIEAQGLGGAIEVHTPGWRVVTVARDGDGKVSAEMRTLLMQEMIGRGVLFQGLFLPCFEHTDTDVEHVGKAFDESCVVYRVALERGVKEFLVGPAVRPVFRKFNECTADCAAIGCHHERGMPTL